MAQSQFAQRSPDGRHTLHYRRIADERENSNVTASTIIPKTNGPATQCFPTTFAGSPRVP